MVAETRPTEDPVMARMVRLLLTVAFLGGMLAVPAARAQSPSQQPDATTPAPATSRSFADAVREAPSPLPDATALPALEGWEPEFLKTLPQPPDQPASLFQGPPAPGPPPPDLERYFEVDPILDAPILGQKPGWFTDVQIQVVQPHINFGQMRLVDPIRFPNGQKVTVAPGAAKMNWTAAPRIEIGYWLPSGFGGFSFSDRFFNDFGGGSFVGPAGSTSRITSFGVNYQDMDYLSREFTPWESERGFWNLEWRAGIRVAETWTRVQVTKPYDQAAATNGVFSQGDTNYTVGAGPHFGVAINRKDLPTGLFFRTGLDIADTFTRVRQQFSAASTTLYPSGSPLRAFYTQNFWNQVPILNYQIGVGWQPPSHQNVKFYVGYIYEFWWQFASNMNQLNPYTNQGATRGNFGIQGLVFQAQWNW
jgi:hypothetical protein